MINKLEELETKRFEWSILNFKDATPESSLIKLKDEIDEVYIELVKKQDRDHLMEEYADCLMCLFDSAGRAGITVHDLTEAFEKKLIKNKSRRWLKNPDNTYSHLKNQEQ